MRLCHAPLIAVMLLAAPAVRAQGIDPIWVSCVTGNDLISRSEFLGEAAAEGSRYALFNVYENEFDEGSILVGRADGNSCTVVLHSIAGGQEPLSTYMPMAAARQMVLLRIQAYRRKIGDEAFRREMAEARANATEPLAPEEAWALQQLGLAAPE